MGSRLAKDGMERRVKCIIRRIIRPHRKDAAGVQMDGEPPQTLRLV